MWDNITVGICVFVWKKPCYILGFLSKFQSHILIHHLWFIFYPLSLCVWWRRASTDVWPFSFSESLFIICGSSSLIHYVPNIIWFNYAYACLFQKASPVSGGCILNCFLVCKTMAVATLFVLYCSICCHSINLFFQWTSDVVCCVVLFFTFGMGTGFHCFIYTLFVRGAPLPADVEYQPFLVYICQTFKYWFVVGSSLNVSSLTNWNLIYISCLKNYIIDSV